MKPRWRLKLMACVALLLAGSTACMERKDQLAGGDQASPDQTEAVLARVLPSTVDVSMAVQRIVELAQTAGGGTCPEIPGVQEESLCEDPDTGVACELNSSTIELRFDGCDADGTSIDGTVRVTGPSRGPLAVRFDLSIGGRSLAGDMTIEFGGCDSLSYNNLTLSESQFTSTLGGELQNCNGAPGGDFTATVNASGLQPFTAHVTFEGGVATIAVNDLETQTPLYLCTWSPSSPGTADCQAASA